MADETPEAPPKKSLNITIKVTYTDPNGEPREAVFLIPEGVLWFSQKRDIRPSHIEALRIGEEPRVPGTVEVRVSYESVLKGT